MEDAILAALLVIEHELDGKLGAPWPFRVRRTRTIALEIARVSWRLLFHIHGITQNNQNDFQIFLERVWRSNTCPGGKDALFDAILLNARGESETSDGQPGGGEPDPGNGEIQVAQAATGTMSDAMPDMPGRAAGSTHIRVENAGDGGAWGGVTKIAKKTGAKAGGVVAGIVVPTNSNHDQTLTIPDQPQYRITGKEREVNRTLEVQNADGSWEPMGSVSVTGDQNGNYIKMEEVNDVLGDRGFEPIGQVDGNSISTDDDQSQTKAPPTTLTETGDRHEDDSCAPEGTDGAWVVVNRGGMSDEAEAYQQQITKTPDLPGKAMIEYEVTDRANVRSVVMDGCAVWSEGKELLDAKYTSGKSRDLHERRPDVSDAIMTKEVRQARDQAGVVGQDHPVEWHVSEGSAQPRFEDAVNRGVRDGSNFSVIHTPAADQNR